MQKRGKKPYVLVHPIYERNNEITNEKKKNLIKQYDLIKFLRMTAFFFFLTINEKIELREFYCTFIAFSKIWKTNFKEKYLLDCKLHLPEDTCLQKEGAHFLHDFGCLVYL